LYNKEENNEEVNNSEEKVSNIYLEGRNAVLEAIHADRTIEKIMVQKGNVEGTIKKIISQAKDNGIVVQEVAKQKLDELSETKNHQGVIALASSHEYAEVEDILALAEKKGEPPFIIILDGITDPHNLGAIIRTANAAGAHGVIIPKRRAVGLTAVVAKTSAGAIEYVPVARVTNITRTIEELKEKNIWVACADMDGADYYKSNLKGAMAIVIGNEGEGVSRLVKEKCDFTVKVPMYGEIASLNASVAAGLFMYEIVRQRKFI
jgi:23S rRNA (guanosine2251-2'-O)-methyltransferase